MLHEHNIIDNDVHFIISDTGEINLLSDNKDSIIYIQQFLHLSESFTFEAPRYIEGHDMSLSNIVNIHFTNIDSKTKEESKDIYPVDGLKVDEQDENKIIFTCKLKDTCTRYVGLLKFSIIFECHEDDVVIYRWPTDIFSKIMIRRTNYNSESIVIEHSDIISEIQNDIKNIKSELNMVGDISKEKISEAVNEYLTANPIEETDPTVPNWAKQAEKPSYTASEVGALPNTTIIPTTLPNPNALTFTGAVTGSYDGSSPVEINIPEGGGTDVAVDTTLSVAGQAADAKATGEKISELKGDIDQLKQAGTGSGSGVTVAQSNSLWAIIQKAAFAEVLTDEELNDFKTAWGITTENIPATGITLDKSTLSFTDSASQTLVATVEPSDTTDKVVWTSNAESVATVANGVVKPVSNGSATITATCGSVLATCSVTVDIAEEEQVTLTSISATYTGGDVAVGTALTDLTGITVTGIYSDGSTSEITGYTLSGEILEGSNTITIIYGGKTTTVTVTGVAESGGGDVGPIYAFESVENAEITSRNGNYTGTVTVSYGNHVRVKAPGNEWFWNINASTAKTHGMVGDVYDTHITDTLFVIPAGATVKMYTKYKINEGTFSNLNVKLDSTQDFTTEVAPAIGTKIGWPSNSMTNTIDEKEVEFTLDEETSVSCIAVDVFPYDTSVDSVIELDIELYVNGERWI